MAEVLVQFDEPQHADDGGAYIAQVWGRLAAGGLWEAWIEFLPTNGGEPVGTGCETEQFSRGDLRYWAAGLTRQYLGEALGRALATYRPHAVRPAPALASVGEPDEVEQLILQTDALARPVPILDPVALYRQAGEYTLRQALRALDAKQLRDIILVYDIPDIDTADVARTFEDALAERIVAGVQQSVGKGQRNRDVEGVRTSQ